MSTSVKARRREWSLRYIAAAAFLIIFADIYESFSHGVYSAFMIVAFVIPLGLGLLPLWLWTSLRGALPGAWTLLFWNYAIAFLTVGSLAAGALAIYGTTNSLLWVYPLLSVVLGAFALGAEWLHWQSA